MVSVRCVWPWRLQGGAVLGLSIRCHDTSPGQLILEKEQIISVSSACLYNARAMTMILTVRTEPEETCFLDDRLFTD